MRSTARLMAPGSLDEDAQAMGDLAPSVQRGIGLTEHPSQGFGWDAPSRVRDVLNLSS